MTNKKFTILTLLIMTFIFLQSALPADLSSTESGVIVEWILRTFGSLIPLDEETLVFVVRKGAHFMEYLILGGFLLLAVKEWMPPADIANGKETHAGRKLILPAWVLGTLYAVSDEVHQYFVPGRSCELRDIVIDSCGALTGAVLFFVLLRVRRRRKA